MNIDFAIEDDENIDKNKLSKKLVINIVTLHRFRDKMEKYLKREITPQKCKILVGLNFDGKAKLKDIANKMGISIPGLCIMFNQLEKDGLVIREVDEKDRRNTYYSVSDSGKVVVKKILEQDQEYCMELLNKTDEKTLEKLSEALSVVNDIIGEWIK